MSIVMWVGLIYLTSEVGLGLSKRAKSGETRGADRGSLLMLWAVIIASVFSAFALRANVPAWNMQSVRVGTVVGLSLFACGLALRWYAILYLGRFFTVNVAIAADHRIIDGGPYRYVRHPSYSGALMAFAGLGCCLGNWGSIAAIMMPCFAAFMLRIRVEESALSHALGEPYRDYMRRTKRLIPAFY